MDNPFIFNHTNSIRVALLTKHAKGPLIAPALAELKLAVTEVGGYDTDLLGTFSGEVDRTLSPLECARKKAQLACEVSGAEYGIGSEGSFGGGPLPGIVNWNTEILVLLHAKTQREIIAQFETSVAITALQNVNPQNLKYQLNRFDDQQAWIVKAPGVLHKGLVGDKPVAQHVMALLDSGVELDTIKIEPDLRAHHCPERQVNIVRAAEQLAERLKSRCPQCNWPNFYHGKPEPGLACELCEMPTKVAKHFEFSCDECGHAVIKNNDKRLASAAQCQWCNP